MAWNLRSLRNSKLYLILDTEVAGYDQLFKIAKESVPAGVDIVQLRDKEGSARDILKFSKLILKILRNRIPYIVNDRLDLALASGAAGVHLGGDDLPLSLARKLTGKKFIIGVSCQNMDQVKAAQKYGADYIGFGSVFKTLTKPLRQPMDLKLLEKVNAQSKIPLFAIGGISENNISILKSIGIKRIAVCRSICDAKDVAQATGHLKNLLMS